MRLTAEINQTDMAVVQEGTLDQDGTRRTSQRKRVSQFREIIKEEIELEEAARQPTGEPSQISPSENIHGKASPDGEKPQPESLLQGMEEIAKVLSEIKEAVAAQSAHVGHVVDAFTELANDSGFLDRTLGPSAVRVTARGILFEDA